ncbi:MAG: signal peptidase I [Hungatella sp.]
MKKELLKFVRYLLGTVVLAILIVSFWIQKVDIYGVSMKPTLSEEDLLFVDKMIYRFMKPERFDVIVFDYRYRKEQYYIKRIIGLPGETIQICGGQIWVDGSLLEEIYGEEPIADPKRAALPITLEEDEYFVLGDNRNDSSDSRDSDIADIKRDQIIGKLSMKMWPMERV